MANPQAGTMPHLVLSLYSAGATWGTGYASHLYETAQPELFDFVTLRSQNINVPVKHLP